MHIVSIKGKQKMKEILIEGRAPFECAIYEDGGPSESCKRQRGGQTRQYPHSQIIIFNRVQDPSLIDASLGSKITANDIT
jgi:hypothetical protein